jgi:hypothetical protein
MAEENKGSYERDEEKTKKKEVVYNKKLQKS